ncbi:MAG: hypothetical protein H6765_04395 [Candidatus Peribacteria bacterium]|nr:MAG: hypothetical protein H6765_04395 [Candidatus Peribacteria bacterium]
MIKKPDAEFVDGISSSDPLHAFESQLRDGSFMMQSLAQQVYGKNGEQVAPEKVSAYTSFE